MHLHTEKSSPQMKPVMRPSLLSASGAALCALLAILILAPVPDAAAALSISVGNPGLQHFDSDVGVQLDFGLTDQNGQPVGNLKPDSVKVFEDGKPAKILDFR